MDEWISVKDRLPTQETDVLLFDCDVGIVFGYYELPNNWTDLTHREWEGECRRLLRVTHWMPLPDSPEERVKTPGVLPG